jgi:uncharacterized protein YozE (UPF0346 family)
MGAAVHGASSEPAKVALTSTLLAASLFPKRSTARGFMVQYLDRHAGFLTDVTLRMRSF